VISNANPIIAMGNEQIYLAEQLTWAKTLSKMYDIFYFLKGLGYTYKQAQGLETSSLPLQIIDVPM
jgi:hypothetical protein